VLYLSGKAHPDEYVQLA